ncbi:MAG: hypothetical protein NT169_20375 [Chloroflexi bacterium]|nr:hypothetical protein [Chloroflexota bacterium]
MVILATIMAVFGVLGFQRGTRSAVVNTVVVLGGLLAIKFGSARIIGFINKLHKGVHFFLASDVPTNVQPLATNDQPGPWLVIVFIVLVALGLLVSQLKMFRGAPSIGGLLLGLVGGYLVSAYLVDALALSAAALPLPFGLSSAKLAQGIATAPEAGKDILSRLNTALGSVDKKTLATLLAVILALFFIAALRLSNKGSQKG